MSRIGTSFPSKHTCPGIRKFVRPTLRYSKCRRCGGNVEVWSDEDKGVCIDCGAEWIKPKEGASCLDYCEHAEQCKEIIERKKEA